MSHTRTLVVIGGVIMSFGLLCLIWVLNSSWKVENISLRGLPNPSVADRDKNLDAGPEFPLQPASVKPFPDQPRDKVKRQPALSDVAALPGPRDDRLASGASFPAQPAAVTPFPDQPREKIVRQPEPRPPSRCEMKLLEPRVALSGTPAEQLEQLLEQPVTLTVANATVGEVVQMLRAALPVNVMLDAKALDEAAFEENTLLQGTALAPLKLRQVLDQLFTEAKLDFLVSNDSLVVTTATAVENHPLVKIYQVGDLIRPAGVEHEQETVDFDSLINLIQSNVTPTTWQANTGRDPNLNPYEPGDLIVIKQTRRGHEQIARLLNELRRGRGLKIPETLKIAGQAVNLAQQQELSKAAEAGKEPAADPNARILRFEFTDDGLSADLLKKMKPAERLEYQLRRRALLQMQNATLPELAKLLGDKLQVNVLLDRKALEEGAFDTATMIQHLPNAGTRLSASLRQLLIENGLSYYVAEETLFLTTIRAEENIQFLRYYAVGELIRPIGSSPNIVPGDSDSLIQLIQSTIQPATWKANGGQGDIAPQETLDLLIVSNTWQILEQLDELIAQLRKVHAAKAETVQANEATLQRVVYQLVLPREETVKETLDKQGLVTAREKLQGELQYSMDDLIDLIKKSIEPASWQDDKHRLDALGSSLIVTHSQATQRKLQSLLHELGITESQHSALQQHGYGIGGFGGGGGARRGSGLIGTPVTPPGTPVNPAATPNGFQTGVGIF